MAKRTTRRQATLRAEEPTPGAVLPPSMNIADVARAAYTHNFELLKHYSGLIFQARIAITSVVAATVAVAFGVVPDRQLPESSISGVPARAIVAYVAAVFVVLLYSIEISYLRHFFQVISCGRAFDKQWRVVSYFTKYDRPESWPLHSAYLIGVGLLIVGFLSEVKMGRELPRDIAAVVVAPAPVFAFVAASRRLRKCVTHLLGSANDKAADAAKAA
jgi:hypothetical protein